MESVHKPPQGWPKNSLWRLSKQNNTGGGCSTLMNLEKWHLTNGFARWLKIGACSSSLAKVLRNALWGGGLKTSQRNMATKQTLSLYTQWQDVNLLLLATYVALMRKETCEYMKTTCEDSIRYKGTEVWAWIRKLAYVTYTYMYLHKHLLFDLETGL